MTDLVADNLKHLLEKAEAGLAALPPYNFRDHALHDQAVAALIRDLEAAGARINDRPSWESSRMSFGGVRSTCTAGTAGAIRNWCTAARKRLGLKK